MANAQAHSNSLTSKLGRLEYTDHELIDFGMSESDVTEYRRRLSTREGHWWGHLSPMEMMMYSAKTDLERTRFARLYLTSNYPKALAERAAATMMYKVSREILRERVGVNNKTEDRRPLLFVHLDCDACKTDVLEIVKDSEAVVDIYVVGLSSDVEVREQLVTWARSIGLLPSQITLNDDNGHYQQRYGGELATMVLVGEP